MENFIFCAVQHNTHENKDFVFRILLNIYDEVKDF